MASLSTISCSDIKLHLDVYHFSPGACAYKEKPKFQAIELLELEKLGKFHFRKIIFSIYITGLSNKQRLLSEAKT